MKDSRFSSIFNEIYSFQARFVGTMYAQYTVCSKEETEDLFQEVCCIVFENLLAGKVSQTSNWWGYVMTVGRNLMTKKLRGIRKEISLDSTPLSEIEDNDMDSLQEERLTKLETVLTSLPEQASAIMTDKYLLQLSDIEIARRHNYANAATVKAKRHQVKKKILAAMAA